MGFWGYLFTTKQKNMFRLLFCTLVHMVYIASAALHRSKRRGLAKRHSRRRVCIMCGGKCRILHRNKSTKNTTFFNLFHFGIFGVPIYNPNKKTFFQVVILYFGAYGIYSILRTSSQQKERFGKVPQQAAGVYRVRREVGRMGCYVGRVRENHESGVLANYGRMRSTGVQSARGVVGPSICDTSFVTNRDEGLYDKGEKERQLGVSCFLH